MFKDENRHYSLRKLSVGLASVLIGISFASGNSHTVKADTVKDSSTGAQTIVQTTAKGSNAAVEDRDAAIKIDAKDDANTIVKANAGFTPKEQSQTSEVVKKNSNAITQDIKQKTVKVSEAAIKVQNNTVKDNSDETALNVKGSKAIAANMPKEGKTEVKENQDWTDPAKNKLQMSTLKAITNKKLNAKMLAVSKVVSQTNDTNGGFDSSWGKLDVNDWQGSVQGDYYQLTDYTGNANHVIVPNEADFEKAGISTSGKQVGVTSNLMHTIFTNKATAQDVTVAFSKTDNKQVKAIDEDWSHTWEHLSDDNQPAKLSKFDGADLDVSNVTNMSDMFSGNQISDLSSLANWNTGNVTNMSGMFSANQISDLSSLAKWNVNNVTDMSYMFSGNQISDLSPLAKWDVSNVTDMGYMFENNQISDLRGLSNWDVSHVNLMALMFKSNQISDLSPLANWNVSNVTNMLDMFEQNQISDLSPISNWNVNNVTSMTAMFSGNQISDLSPLAKWDVSHVTDMGEMFRNNQISDLSPLVNWKVDKVTNMSGMFVNNRISDVSPLDNWKVNNMIDMFGIFDGNISSIPLNTVKAERIINFVYPDGYTGKKQGPVTQIVDVPTKQVRVELTTNYSRPAPKVSAWVTKAVSAWVTKTETPETPGPVYFQDYTVLEIKGLLEPDKTVISKQQADITKPINVTVTYKSFDSNTNDAFALDSKHGLHEHANVNDNGGYNEDFWGKINVDDWNYTVNNDKIEINGLKDGVSTGANDAVIVPNLDDFKLTGKYRDAKAVYLSKDALSKTAKHKYYGLSKTNGNKFVTDSNVNSAFKDDSNLTHADLNSLNTSNITDMTYMFNGASGLTSLDVSNWDTGNVTDMSNMFNGASSLHSLDVSNWETGNVTNMYAMFSDASSLTSLDVSKWNTGNVTDMGLMFNGDSSLTSLDVSNWDTSKVTNMSLMFNNCKNKNLTSVGDLSNWDTSKVTNMSLMFNGDSSLTSLDVSNWNTGNVTNMSMMFNGDSSLTSLDVSKWNTGNVTNMGMMFNGASSLHSLDVSNWETGNVTNMSLMFNNCKNLTSVGDLSNWDTSKVTNMSMMFNGDSSLTSLDVSNWDTSKVTNMSLMFNNCKNKNLTSVGDLSNWDTSKVTNMSLMFNGDSSLTSLDVSNWNTGNVTNMGMMFNGASSLTNLNVSKWDTSKVTNMSMMFNGDSSLTSLDVSNWNTGKVTDMSEMFYNASSLTDLDVSNWDTSKVTNMGLMFSSDPKLALIVNGDKFADYLVKNNFAGSNIDSGVKSVTTNNAKLLQLLTNDVQHNSATRTIVFTFPANYSPDLAKYHLTKTGNTYQIKQSVDYDKPYLQGTVLINAIYDITEHHIDTTKPNKLSDTWWPNYDKLILAHKNSDGSVSFDAIQLPKVPGYKIVAKTVANPVNPARALFAISFMALPKPVTPVQNDAKPAKTVTPATPVAIEVAKPIKTEPKVATTPKAIDLSNDVVAITPDVSTWQVANNLEHNTYHVSNGKYTVELPHISNAQLHVIVNDSTKNSVLFTYKGQNTKYVFNIKFVNGHYLLSTYEIKSGKLVKLIDYNFIKSSKMIDIILEWLKR